MFKPGQSGNPNGRPKDTLGSIIRQKTKDGEWIYSEVMKLYKNKKSRIQDKVHILEFLTDRGWGKATQQVESESLNEVIKEMRNRYIT